MFGKDRTEAVDDDDEGFGPLRAAFEGCAPPTTTADTCAAADLLVNESDLPNYLRHSSPDWELWLGDSPDEGNVGGQEETSGAEGGVSPATNRMDAEPALAVEDSQQPQSMGTAVLNSDDEGAEAKDVVADSEEEDVCFGRRRRASGRVAGPITTVLVEDRDDDGDAMQGEKVVIDSGKEEDLIVMDDDGDACEEVAPRAHPSSRPPFRTSKRGMGSPPLQQRSVRGARSSLSSFSSIPMFVASRTSAPGLASPSSPVDRPAGGHVDYSWMDRLPHYTPISVLERTCGRSGDPGVRAVQGAVR